MGESIKSSNSDIEDEEEIMGKDIIISDSRSPTPPTQDMMHLTPSDLRNLISDQLEKQLQSSITKAITSAMEHIHENEPRDVGTNHNPPPMKQTRPPVTSTSGGDSMPDFGNHNNKLSNGKKNYTRRHTSPALKVQISEDGEDETSDEDDDGCCQGSNEHFGLTIILLQVVLIILFGFLVKYDEAEVHANPNQTVQDEGESDASNETSSKPNSLSLYYSQYQDIQVMIFLGIGVLMAFLRKYGYSAIGLSLLAGTFSVQWLILVKGLIRHKGDMIPVTIVSLIEGDFAAAVVLISFGVVIGAVTPLQLIIMTFSEVVFYAANEYIGVELLEVVDTGGSLFVHIFAAYFGLAVSRTFISSKNVNMKECEPNYISNILCIISVIFLWLFWPSFNSVLSTGNAQHRVVINTMLALFGSCVFSFGFSALFNKNKMVMAHIQNGSLAGGVAVGAAVDLMIRPFGALTIGALGGILCVFGVQFLTPFLSQKMGLHDSCGVHNLHGMPGLLAGFAGVVMAGLAAECDYGQSLYLHYPARAPLENTTAFFELQKLYPKIQGGKNRTAAEQAMYQLSAIGVTLVMSIGGGIITGLIMKIPIFGKVKQESHFEDKRYWVMEDEQVPVPKLTAKVNGISALEDSKTHSNHQAFDESTIRRRTKYEL